MFLLVLIQIAFLGASASAADCGGKITGLSSGSFTSPNYGSSFPFGGRTWTKCFWTITVPAGKMIELTVDEFDFPDDKCASYFHFATLLNFGDRERFIPKYYQVFCSDAPPSPGKKIITEDNEVSVGMAVPPRDTLAAKGFKVSFKAVDPGPSVVPSPNCGANLVQPKGEVSGTSYPAPFKPLEVCRWRIRNTPGTATKLTFANYSMPAECDSANVQVQSISGVTLVCGGIGDPKNDYYVTDPSAILTFLNRVPSNTGQFTGVRITYESGVTPPPEAILPAVKSCGANLTSDGEISSADLYSPNGDGYAKGRYVCTNTVSVLEMSVIKYTFLEFDLQVYTSLAVTDGDVTTTYTKANPPTIGQEITAKTRNLKIKFVALFLNSKNKFRIKIDRSASGS